MVSETTPIHLTYVDFALVPLTSVGGGGLSWHDSACSRYASLLGQCLSQENDIPGRVYIDFDSVISFLCLDSAGIGPLVPAAAKAPL